MTAPEAATGSELTEQAEAALDRVRALAGHIDQCRDLSCDDCPTDPHDFVRMLRSAIDGVE